jgi:hypothetical protein
MNMADNDLDDSNEKIPREFNIDSGSKERNKKQDQILGGLIADGKSEGSMDSDNGDSLLFGSE